MENTGSPEILQINNLEIGYRGSNLQQGIKNDCLKIAGPLQLQVPEGLLVSLIGPNGSGKSTLLRTLAGLLNPLDGEIIINGQNLNRMKSREVARRLSVVLTDPIQPGNLTVYALVALGRYPYTGWLGKLSSGDHEKIQYALHATGAAHLATRNINALSDGEKQKVMIARALSQDTDLIILDEPTAHLDLPNRVEIIRLLKNLAAETGKAIIMSTHELDLALQASDKLWLMTGKSDESAIITGVPEDLVLSGKIGDVFARKGIYFDKNTGSFKVAKSAPINISIHGDTTLVFWTSRALERIGFAVTCESINARHIEVSYGKGNEPVWHCQFETREEKFYSVASLLGFLKNLAPGKQPNSQPKKWMNMV